jgi:transcriptional regulator with XRE-family HTH domain
LGRPWLVVDRLKVRELRAQGLSLRALAAKLDISFMSVSRIVRASYPAA